MRIKLIFILFLLITSCSCFFREKDINNEDIHNVKLHQKLENLLGKEKSTLIFDFVNDFDMFLSIQYKEYPKEERIKAYLNNYKKFKEKKDNSINFNSFKELEKKIYRSGLIDEFIVKTDQYLEIDTRVYQFYDSLYYKHFSSHFSMPIDSVIYYKNDLITRDSLRHNIIFNNPFNRVYYSLCSSFLNRDNFFNEMLEENLLYNYSPLNLTYTLLEKKDIDLNNIHYRIYIAFETILLPHYRANLSRGKDKE